jgi:TolB-like protein
MVNLDGGIREVADYLDKKLNANSVVVVLNIKSDHQKLSNYIIEELTNNIVNMGNLIAVERRDLDVIQNEMTFQLSGEVSDESAQAIGKKLGAQTIISGEISPVNRMYRLGIKAISVETAVIQGTVNKNIRNDHKLKTLTGGSGNFPISIGGGVRIGASFSEGTLEGKGRETIQIDQYYYNCNYATTETKSKSEFDIGTFIFFDLKYAEINMSVYNASGRSQRTWDKDYYYNNKTIQTENKKNTGNASALLLDMGILAKYPFYLNKVTLFPSIGAEYQLWLSAAENGKKVTDDLSANNSIWIKAGGGIDYALTPSLFIRGELLWGLKLNSKNENRDSFTYFTHGPTVNIGMGYIFNRKTN